MKIIRQSNSVSPFQRRRSQKTRGCGWKKINSRSREGGDGTRWEDRVCESERKWPEDKGWQKRRTDEGIEEKNEMKSKSGRQTDTVSGEKCDRTKCHTGKKDKSRERCLSKLGNCPPWYLSHSNLISTNRLHYCCCSPPLTRDFLSFSHHSIHSPQDWCDISRETNVCYKQSAVCLPPFGPGSGGPRLMPPQEWPVQPLSLFTLVFLLFSHSSLWRTAKRRQKYWVNQGGRGYSGPQNVGSEINVTTTPFKISFISG